LVDFLDSGLSIAGLLAVLLNISVLLLDVDIELTGGFCFAVVSVIALAGLVLFWQVNKSEFFQYYTNLPQQTDNRMVNN
jgi:hypothetical protein